MSPHAPPEVSPLRAREVHAPPPEIVAAAGKLRLRLRSGYVTFLPPAHFKQSFHEFCYWRLCGVCVDRFRDVSVWTIDIGHWELFISIAVYQLCLEDRFVRRLVRDGATFLRCHPWDGLAVTVSSSVGFPEGKSSYCWSRLMDNMSCRIFRLLQTPVSQVLYRLAPAEMTKLKEHVEDSSDKGFIRPVKILDHQVEVKQGMMTMWVKVRTERDEIHEEASETKQMDYSEFCETNKYVIFGRTWCYWTFLSDFIWAWVRVVGFMGFYITGYCWWPVVLKVRETGVTLLYDDASGVIRCPPYRR
uniref:Uncharacterized protein n=2 Tax=Brassica oleracea TaxID=3712 RepID=A0A0D3D4C1_BRAOL|nr:unnamed protein product [Brassica oleracea]